MHTPCREDLLHQHYHAIGFGSSTALHTAEEVIPEERHQGVGKEEGETSHLERWINTLRQRRSRFVRKTLSFSKSCHMHHCCLKLFVYRYNLERRSVILG